MHGHTPWVSRERPDLARSGPEHCWIDGDLIRLSQFPVGGIRPGVRGKPVPWLMDLAVLEEAMQDVYGGGFRLGTRAPLLQLAANALAAGDRSLAAEIATSVVFPPPEFASRFRDAGYRYLAWGPAHTRGNPPIDVDAWLARMSFERKYDPDQPRVPRGHPDGGQWTDGNGATSDLDHPVTDEEVERSEHVLAELEALVARSAPNLLHFVGGPRDPLEPPERFRGLGLPPLSEEEATSHLPTARPTMPPPPENRPTTRAQLIRQMIPRVSSILRFASSRSVRALVLSILIEEGFPEVTTYFDEPKALDEMRPSVRVENYITYNAFEEENPAGPGYQWHHIREQSFDSPRGWNVDATENIIRIPVVHHRRISAFYSSKPEDLGGPSIREWLRTKSPEFQWRFGLIVLQWQGVMK